MHNFDEIDFTFLLFLYSDKNIKIAGGGADDGKILMFKISITLV